MKHSLMILMIVAVTGNVRAQFPGAPQGVVQEKSMTSEVLGVERNYSVYLPKSYESETDREYPILYLLHGVFDTNKGWQERGHLQDVANRLINSNEVVEMIVVLPDAGTEWNGYFDMDGWSYETFFFEEFLPYIESTYRIKGRKENRAIAGLSMGGGGTLVYAQKHPEMFSSAYALSALTTLGEGEGLNQQDPKFAELNRTVRENSAVQFVADADEDTKEKLKSVRWYVDCGDDDFLFEANIAFVQEMKKAQIPLQFRVRDGGHDWEYWHSGLYEVLRFVSFGFLN